jgi:hypothetical protein
LVSSKELIHCKDCILGNNTHIHWNTGKKQSPDTTANAKDRDKYDEQSDAQVPEQKQKYGEYQNNNIIREIYQIQHNLDISQKLEKQQP